MELTRQPSPHFIAQVTERGSRPRENNWYKLKSTFRPSRGDIVQAQTFLGFDPAGYGGPSDIDIKEVSANKFITVWSSSASSD